MTVRSPFLPKYGANTSVTVAAASSSTTIGFGSKSLLLTNIGANICYVRVYGSINGIVAATTADLPVPAGTSRVIGKDQDHDSVATISASGTTLLVMPGEGGFN